MGSRLEVPCLRVRIARRAAMLRVAHARRDVAQAVRYQPDAKPRRRLADRAYAVLLVHQDLPDLLCILVAAFRLETGGLGIQVEDLQDVGIIGLLALRAAGRVPLRILGPECRTRYDRYRPGRE